MLLKHLQKARQTGWLLAVVSVFLLFGFLSARELWTQEHRWADIVAGMFYRHDFFHPFLGETNYYDKPLLSYWLIALVAKITGALNMWALRIPSALAGLLSIWSIYRLGTKLKNQQVGLLAGWMLLTTFYFIFWARTSSADMMNMAGTLFAVSWYFDKRDQANFLDYMIFGLILAVTALCKGLVGPVVVLIAIFPDVLLQKQWKQYLRIPVLLSLIPAAIVYCLPFWASTQFGNSHYEQSGLYLVYRENILRYFQPFDHKDPLYTYFVYLPIYLFPWTLFFIPALCSIRSRWRSMTVQSKWMVWSLLLIFLFFTFSGSRRSYYVLPIVPFAILLTADWIIGRGDRLVAQAKRLIMISFVVLVANFIVLQPLYYAKGGAQGFAATLKQTLGQTQSWDFVLLDAESKLNFYLQLPPAVKTYDIGGERHQQTDASLMARWAVIKTYPKNTIFISRKQYEPFLTALLKDDYQLIEGQPNLGGRLLNMSEANLPIAYIPKSGVSSLAMR